MSRKDELKLTFESMTNPVSKLLYTTLWGGEGFSRFEGSVRNTVVKGGESKNSFSFFTDPEDSEEDTLIKVFGIEERELFKEKFRQSGNGSGAERARILRLNSSALCGLLFFYNVTDKHPLELAVEGRKYIFTYSEVEYKNPVTRGGEPSNVDVVLVGKSETAENVVLFLESKLFEYFYGAACTEEIAKRYLTNELGSRIYSAANMKKLELRIDVNYSETAFRLMSDKPCYLQGLKQMISHFIGVSNLLNCGEKRTGFVAEKAKSAKVLLGTILFDERIGKLRLSDHRECFSDYSRRYSALADILNQNAEGFSVLREPLRYSIFKDSAFAEERIREFYFNCGA